MKMSSRTPSVKQRQRAEVVHMLDKLNQYRQNFALPFYKKNHKATSYSFEWVEDLAGLQQVQQFRAMQFGAQFNLHFANGLDQDLYDFNCEHAVLRDKVTQEIVAYTRIKRLQGYELVTKSYSQHEFDIASQLGHLEHIVEIGRTCVHPRYRSGKALSVLWLNLLPKVLWEMKAKYVIGCVSVRLKGNEAQAYYTHQFIKNLKQGTNSIRAQQSYEPAYPQYSFKQDERIPKLFDVYLKMQATLSQQAYYDQEFNCVDYFVFLEVAKMAKNFIFHQRITQ